MVNEDKIHLAISRIEKEIKLQIADFFKKRKGVITSVQSVKDRNESFRKAIVQLFVEAINEERKRQFSYTAGIIGRLADCYLGHYSSWQIHGSDKEADAIVLAYRDGGGEKAIDYIMHQVAWHSAQGGDKNALDLYVHIAEDFRDESAHKAAKHLTSLSKLPKPGIKELIVERIMKQINRNHDLINVLAKIDQTALAEVCLKWLNQKDYEKKEYAFLGIDKLDLINVEQYKKVLKVLDGFWQNRKFREDFEIRKIYYSFIARAYLAGAIIEKSEAIDLICGVFTSKGYPCPAEQETLKESIKKIDRENFRAIYAASILKASRREKSDCRPFWDEELKSLTLGMSKDEAFDYWSKLVVQAREKDILWRAAVKLLNYSDTDKVRAVFQKALISDHPGRISTLSQLLFRIADRDDGFGKIPSESRSLASLVIERSKSCTNLKVLASIAEETANWGSEKQIEGILPSLELLLKEASSEDWKRAVRAALLCICRGKKRQNKDAIFGAFKNLYQVKRKEVLDVLAKVIKEDWRGSLMEVLSNPALELIVHFNDDYSVSRLGVIIRDKDRGSGDLNISINSECAKFIKDKAIEGNLTAANFLAQIPDGHIWNSLSGRLVEVYNRTDSVEVKKIVLDALLIRFYQSVTKKGRERLYMHEEIKAFKVVKEIESVQTKFLEALQAGLKIRQNVDVMHIINEVYRFVHPKHKQQAVAILTEGIKTLKEAFEGEHSRWGMSEEDRRLFSKISVAINEQILKLAA